MHSVTQFPTIVVDKFLNEGQICGSRFVSASSSLDITYQQMLANTGQVDIVQAISQMSQQQLSLQTAQKPFVQISARTSFIAARNSKPS